MNMVNTEQFDPCDKECFASINGKCYALKKAIPENCPFQRTDITMEQQERDIRRYSYLYGSSDEEV